MGVGLACRHIMNWLSTSTVLKMILDADKIEAVKILRVVRLFRVFRFFRQLSTLALMVADSVKQLLWALVMFLLIMCLGKIVTPTKLSNERPAKPARAKNLCPEAVELSPRAAS